VIERLRDSARFYGVSAVAVVVEAELPPTERLDAGLASAEADAVMLWRPSALPIGSDWLRSLESAAARGIASPALLRADDSVAYCGLPVEQSSSPRWLEGMSAQSLPDCLPFLTSAPSQNILVSARETLLSLGGFGPGLLTDASLADDLGARASCAGVAITCVPRTRFWLLDPPSLGQQGPARVAMERLDREVIAARARVSDKRRVA
jgi:hypothetical protein